MSLSFKFKLAVCSVGLACVSSCMFDIVRVKQAPANFSLVADSSATFTLNESVEVSIGTGFKPRLRSGTVWRQVGKIEAGDVFTTDDQVLTVEASNVHEARLVVRARALMGFYLPVEKTFVGIAIPRPLKISSRLTNQ